MDDPRQSVEKAVDEAVIDANLDKIRPAVSQSDTSIELPDSSDRLDPEEISEQLTDEFGEDPIVRLHYDDDDYLAMMESELRRLHGHGELDGITVITDDPTRFDTDQDLKDRAAGLYNPGTGELYAAPEEVIGEAPRERQADEGYFSTDKNFGSVWHELGHHRIRVENPDAVFEGEGDEDYWGQHIIEMWGAELKGWDDWFDPESADPASKKKARNEARERITDEVSEYAEFGGMEFIAEVYAGLMAGNEYSDDIMDLHSRLMGPVPPADARDPETAYHPMFPPTDAAVESAVGEGSGSFGEVWEDVSAFDLWDDEDFEVRDRAAEFLTEKTAIRTVAFSALRPNHIREYGLRLKELDDAFDLSGIDFFSDTGDIPFAKPDETVGYFIHDGGIRDDELHVIATPESVKEPRLIGLSADEWLVVDDRYQTVVHETAHYLHFREFQKLEERPARAWDQYAGSLTSEERLALSEEVSEYAKTNPFEAVAEIATGLMYGMEFSERVMDIYEEHLGPPVESLDIEPVTFGEEPPDVTTLEEQAPEDNPWLAEAEIVENAFRRWAGVPTAGGASASPGTAAGAVGAAVESAVEAQDPGGRDIGDIIEDAATFEDESVADVLDEYGAMHVKEHDGKDYYAIHEDKVWVVTVGDDYAHATPFKEWIYDSWTWGTGLSDWLDNAVADNFERDFYRSSTAYHVTEPDNAARVIASGALKPRNETRGTGNRGIGGAVFLSQNSPIGVYGDVTFVVDVDKMQEDGFTPAVDMEPEVREAKQRGAIASSFMVHDFRPEIPHDVSQDTAIIHEEIPLKYLSMRGDDSAIEAVKGYIEDHADGEERDEAMAWIAENSVEAAAVEAAEVEAQAPVDRIVTALQRVGAYEVRKTENRDSAVIDFKWTTGGGDDSEKLFSSNAVVKGGEMHDAFLRMPPVPVDGYTATSSVGPEFEDEREEVRSRVDSVLERSDPPVRWTVADRVGHSETGPTPHINFHFRDPEGSTDIGEFTAFIKRFRDEYADEFPRADFGKDFAVPAAVEAQGPREVDRRLRRLRRFVNDVSVTEIGNDFSASFNIPGADPSEIDSGLVFSRAGEVVDGTLRFPSLQQASQATRGIKNRFPELVESVGLPKHDEFVNLGFESPAVAPEVGRGERVVRLRLNDIRASNKVRPHVMFKTGPLTPGFDADEVLEFLSEMVRAYEDEFAPYAPRDDIEFQQGDFGEWPWDRSKEGLKACEERMEGEVDNQYAFCRAWANEENIDISEAQAVPAVDIEAESAPPSVIKFAQMADGLGERDAKVIERVGVDDKTRWSVDFDLSFNNSLPSSIVVDPDRTVGRATLRMAVIPIEGWDNGAGLGEEHVAQRAAEIGDEVTALLESLDPPGTEMDWTVSAVREGNEDGPSPHVFFEPPDDSDNPPVRRMQNFIEGFHSSYVSRFDVVEEPGGVLGQVPGDIPERLVGALDRFDPDEIEIQDTGSPRTPWTSQFDRWYNAKDGISGLYFPEHDFMVIDNRGQAHHNQQWNAISQAGRDWFDTDTPSPVMPFTVDMVGDRWVVETARTHGGLTQALMRQGVRDEVETLVSGSQVEPEYVWAVVYAARLADVPEDGEISYSFRQPGASADPGYAPSHENRIGDLYRELSFDGKLSDPAIDREALAEGGPDAAVAPQAPGLDADEIEQEIKELDSFSGGFERREFPSNGTVSFDFKVGGAERPTSIAYDMFTERPDIVIVRLPPLKSELVREDREETERRFFRVFRDADREYHAIPQGKVDVLIAGPRGKTPHVEGMDPAADERLFGFIDALVSEYMDEFSGDIDKDADTFPQDAGMSDDDIADIEMDIRDLTRGRGHSYRNFDPDEFHDVLDRVELIKDPEQRDAYYADIRSNLRFIEAGRFDTFLERISDAFGEFTDRGKTVFTERNPDTVRWLSVWNRARDDPEDYPPHTQWVQKARESDTGGVDRYAADPPPFELPPLTDDLLDGRLSSYRRYIPGEFVEYAHQQGSKFAARELLSDVEFGRWAEALGAAFDHFVPLDPDERTMWARRNPGLMEWVSVYGWLQDLLHGDQFFSTAEASFPFVENAGPRPDRFQVERKLYDGVGAGDAMSDSTVPTNTDLARDIKDNAGSAVPADELGRTIEPGDVVAYRLARGPHAWAVVFPETLDAPPTDVSGDARDSTWYAAEIVVLGGPGDDSDYLENFDDDGDGWVETTTHVETDTAVADDPQFYEWVIPSDSDAIEAAEVRPQVPQRRAERFAEALTDVAEDWVDQPWMIDWWTDEFGGRHGRGRLTLGIRVFPDEMDINPTDIHFGLDEGRVIDSLLRFPDLPVDSVALESDEWEERNDRLKEAFATVDTPDEIVVESVMAAGHVGKTPHVEFVEEPGKQVSPQRFAEWFADIKEAFEDEFEEESGEFDRPGTAHLDWKDPDDRREALAKTRKKYGANAFQSAVKSVLAEAAEDWLDMSADEAFATMTNGEFALDRGELADFLEEHSPSPLVSEQFGLLVKGVLEEKHGKNPKAVQPMIPVDAEFPDGPARRPAQNLVEGLDDIDGLEIGKVKNSRNKWTVDFRMPDPAPTYPSSIVLANKTGNLFEMTIRLGPIGEYPAVDRETEQDLEGRFMDVALDAASDADVTEFIKSHGIDLGDAWISEQMRPHVRVDARTAAGREVPVRNIVWFVESLAERFDDRFGTLEDRMVDDEFADYFSDGPSGPTAPTRKIADGRGVLIREGEHIDMERKEIRRQVDNSVTEALSTEADWPPGPERPPGGRADRPERDELNDREFGIIVPKTDNAGSEIKPAVIRDYAERMSERFGGVTVVPSVAGCWVPDEGDELVCEENAILRAIRDSDDGVWYRNDEAWMEELAEEVADELGQAAVLTSEEVTEVQFVGGELKESLPEDMTSADDVFSDLL